MLNTRSAVMAALALAVAAVAILSAPASAAVAVGDKAPDFQLNTLDGKTIKLSNLTNKPTLLVFWVSWCPHCQVELPVLQKVYTDLKPKGINAVGVSVDKDIDDAKEFVRKYKLTFPNAYGMTDDGIKVLEAYDIRGVPTIYIIDKGGKVAARHVGEVPEKEIRKEFAKLGVK